jgi:hypothetical protein
MTARHALVVTVSILIWVNQSPAPIVEEEKTTPAQSEAPKRKHAARASSAKAPAPESTSASEESSADKAKTKSVRTSAPQGPARFAGMWTGKVNQGLLGHVPTSLTVNSTATSVELSQNLGGGAKQVSVNGNSISWKSGVAGEIHWTLTPNSDGQAAQVTMKGLMLNDTTTFRRGPPK